METQRIGGCARDREGIGIYVGEETFGIDRAERHGRNEI